MPERQFPLPWIDQIVDSTTGQGMLSFLDAFSGYHQIPMSPIDEEKTAFITPYDLYCYKVMPFGLKNAGATYQRLMTKIFKPPVSRTVEVYINDIVARRLGRDKHRWRVARRRQVRLEVKMHGRKVFHVPSCADVWGSGHRRRNAHGRRVVENLPPVLWQNLKISFLRT